MGSFLFVMYRSERYRDTSLSYLLLGISYTFNSFRLCCQLLSSHGFGNLIVFSDLFYIGFVSFCWAGVRKYAKPLSIPRHLLLLPLALGIWVIYSRRHDVPFTWLTAPSHFTGTLVFVSSGYYFWQLHRRRSNLGHLTLAVMLFLQGVSTATYPFTRNSWYAPYGFSIFSLLTFAIGMGFIVSELKSQQNLLLSEIEARKLAEEERIRSHVIIDNITSNSPTGIAVFDGTTGACVLANQTLSDISGGSVEELLTLNFRDNTIWNRSGLAAIADATITDGVKRENEINIVSSFNKSMYIDCIVTRFYVDTKPYLLFVALDISERKNLETQLLHAQKIESIGRLAGGIAHDFNNLLTPIFGYAELLKRDFPDGAPSRAKLDNIIMAADKARILTQQLLTFARKHILEMKIVDLNKVITSFYEILRRTIRDDIVIQLRLTSDTVGIRADKNLLEQILLNLVINAQDAIVHNGVITIATEHLATEEEVVLERTTIAAGRYLMLSIVDNGCGIGEETIAHIFEPFFTTKEVGEGSGLGLSTVYGLVSQHDGRISVSSEVGKGTAFTIYFPVVAVSPEIDSEGKTAPAVLTGNASVILLVEDNEMVRQLARDILSSHGFTVIEAGNPAEAAAASKGKRIDLLVTDVVMPEIRGPELYQLLLTDHPDLKVLYMSGYTNDIIVRHGVVDDAINFIQKPFTASELAKKVETALDGGSQSLVPPVP